MKKHTEPGPQPSQPPEFARPHPRPQAPLPPDASPRPGANPPSCPIEPEQPVPQWLRPEPRRVAWDRLGVAALGILLIFLLHLALRPSFSGLRNASMSYARATIDEVLETRQAGTQDYKEVESEALEARYLVTLTDGKFKGEQVEALAFFPNPSIERRMPQAGDRIFVGVPQPLDTIERVGDVSWRYDQFDRSIPVGIFAVAFAVLFVIQGRLQGLAALISLGLTLGALFLNFIPALLVGWPIVPVTLIFCLFVSATSVYLILGRHPKALVTFVGTIGGVFLSALLVLLMQSILQLNGIMGEESFILYAFNPQKPIDLQGVIFSMILIGSLGAVMDVAMDLASSLYEIHLHAPELQPRELVSSGFSIGRDIMGTMANTLILAYCGSSLPLILIQVLYSPSLGATLNQESVLIEMLNALIGSMGLLLTVPLTSLVAAWVYSRRPRALGTPGGRA